jgi:hypothetical protein
MDDLEEKQIDLMEGIREARVEQLQASVSKAYVDDFKALLGKDAIVEQKSFLGSFAKRIELNQPQMAIDYTIPLETQKVEPLSREVLPFVYSGSSAKPKDRTFRAMFGLADIGERCQRRVKSSRRYRNPIIFGSRMAESFRE